MDIVQLFTKNVLMKQHLEQEFPIKEFWLDWHFVSELKSLNPKVSVNTHWNIYSVQKNSKYVMGDGRKLKYRNTFCLRSHVL